MTTPIARTLAERWALAARQLGATEDDSLKLRGLPAEKLPIALGEIVDRIAPEPCGETAYLLLYATRGSVPTPKEVTVATREWRSLGTADWLDELDGLPILRHVTGVRVATKPVVLVTETASTAHMSGIQRVVRECVKRWPLDELELLVNVRESHRSYFRTAHAEELLNVIGPEATARVVATDPQEGEVAVIPYKGSIILPELELEPLLTTLGRFAACHTSAIVFDCIPLTTAETASPGMPGAFTQALTSLSWFDEVMPISEAAAIEYRAWRGMLVGSGREGPAITTVDLPFTTKSVTEEVRTREMAKLRLANGHPLPGNLPLVLAVGSHEPRKNHVNLLFAAEMLWREGLEFALVMPGSGSWEMGYFPSMCQELRGAGRPLVTIEKASDDLIWSLYATAQASVFCSFNEGFGLPVVESLAAGVPVITSDLGSMKELAEGHGGLLVNPRDPYALRDALRSLLTDAELVQRLKKDMEHLPERSWDDYAAETWRIAASR